MEASAAAADFIHQIKLRFMPEGERERIVSVILDGENAWGSYEQAGRKFFHALYSALEADAEIRTVTFGEYLAGAAERGLRPHPLREQERVCELAHASWIDEWGSRPGNDLGTWIGEPEENAAWELLREVRERLRALGATTQTHPRAFEAIHAAEGSDWFWWYGDDQTCDVEPLFDDLFRRHLRAACRFAGITPPAKLDRSIVPRAETWTFTDQRKSISGHDRLRFKVGCPACLPGRWMAGRARTPYRLPPAVE